MRLWLLGVPINNVTMDQARAAAIKLADLYKRDGNPEYIATINSDFIAQANASEEFNAILRDLDFTVADGMPIILLTRWLGCPLPMRVTGQDLFPLLVMDFTARGKSIYLMGGEPATIEKCVKKLKHEFPGVKIAGTSTPFIEIKGPGLIEAAEIDRFEIEDINEARPDILFLQLGSPKQEIWYSRNKHHLKVPLSIGIGGSFERYADIIPRAPLWMQNNSLEWLYRLMKEPKRLWRRYLFDAYELTVKGLPLLFYYHFNRILQSLLHTKNCLTQCNRPPLLFLSSHRTITVIRLSCTIEQSDIETLRHEFVSALEQEAIVLDFKATRHIDLYGFYQIFSLWREAREKNKTILALNLSGDLRLLFKLNKLWDYVKDDVVDSPSQIAARISEGALFQSLYQDHDTVHLYFLGELTAAHPYEAYYQALLPIINTKPLHIDLTYVPHIHTPALTFLLKLKPREVTGRHLEGEFRRAGVSYLLK